MTAAIAGYRTAILALLADAGKVIFTDLDMDQSLRWALSEYSIHCPLIRTYQYSVLGTTAIHTMPTTFITRQVTKVELWNLLPDCVTDLAFYAYRPDEQWVIETKYQYHTGDTLTIYYTDVHQVDGLDAAAGTTVLAADESWLQVGAAGRAALMRAMNRIENIAMNPTVTETYRKMAAEYSARFAYFVAGAGPGNIGLPYFPGDEPTNLVF
jgi:hypothetical protein